MESIDSTGNKVVPSPWYPPAKRIDAFNYCHSLYEMAITKLSLRLNKLHGVSYPDKYWRILIGPWLLHYITVLFDRYKRLKKALDTFPSFYTYVLPKEKCSLVSYSTDDFMFGGFWKVRDDLYNHFLFSIIAHEICPENIIERDCGYEIKANVIRRGWKRKIFNVLKSPIDKGFRGYILLDEMYHISLKELFMLKVKTGFNRLNFVEMFGSSLPDNMLLIDKYSKDMRATLKIDCTGDEFESILFKVVPEAIPICYIEDYRYHKNKIKTMNNLKFIGSLVGWNYNETFKLYSAESKLNGAKLVEFQHGGGYGSSPIGPMNTLAYEKDVFYSWGWTDKKRKNVKPLPSVYLSRLINTYTGRLNKILMVGTGVDRHIKRIDTVLFPDDITVYFHDKKRFLAALKEVPQSRIMYRPDKELDWKEVDCIMDVCPTIEIVKKKKLMHWMQNAKVVVSDYSGTSFLEALIINVPTVLFWDHEVFLMRSDAEPYLQALRDAGILYKDPVSAAEKVNEIYDNPGEWWLSDKVQDARKEFCRRFAYARRDWIDVWVKELRKFN
jgi:putative transferase (TIGR04331 family)